MEVVLAGAGVAARLGVAPGAHHRDTKRDQPVAQAGWFAGREHDTGVRQKQAQRTNGLDEGAVVEIGERLELPGAGAEARQRKGELRFPAVPQQVLCVGGEAEGLAPPVAQPEQCPDAEPPEPGRVGTLRRLNPPVEVTLGAGGVHVSVNVAVVGFLINNQSLRSGLDERLVFLSLHRADLKRDRRHGIAQRRDAVGKVAAGDELGMLAGDEQDVAEAVLGECLRLAHDFID